MGTMVLVEPWTSGGDEAVPVQRSSTTPAVAVAAAVAGGVFELSREQKETQQPWPSELASRSNRNKHGHEKAITKRKEARAVKTT